MSESILEDWATIILLGVAKSFRSKSGEIGRLRLWAIQHRMSSMSRRNGTAVLERLLDPVSQCLNVEAARKLVRLKADAKTQARVDEFARKCNEGELTPKEHSEYELYVTAGNLIAILQAQARLILAKRS
jgi:hypothetical protein